MKTPCQDCEIRHIGCHATCDSYNEYVKENERIKKIRKKEEQAYRFHRDSIMDAKRRKRG